MKKQKILLSLICLAITVFLLAPFTFEAAASDSPCLIDKLLEKEHYLRGDVNNDGMVNWDDIQAILDQITTDSQDEFYNPADVNCDCKVNYDDESYLRNYLSGKGPAPCVANVQYCSESPCIVRINNAIVELRADVTGKDTNHASWLARAYNTDGDNKKEIARFSLDIDYGEQITTIGLSYERKNSPFGLADIPRTETKDSIRTPYSNEGERGEVDTLTALMGLSTLVTVKGNSQPDITSGLKVPRSPSGCNAPVNIPKYPPSEQQDACWVKHDFCYQRGGNEQDRKNCDKEFFDCLSASVVPNEIFWCGKWVYRKEYIKEFIRLFNASSFRYHNEDWTCFFRSEGKDIDSLLDTGTLIQDCSSCKGKDACDVKCVVEVGGTRVEYPCSRPFDTQLPKASQDDAQIATTSFTTYVDTGLRMSTMHSAEDGRTNRRHIYSLNPTGCSGARCKQLFDSRNRMRR